MKAQLDDLAETGGGDFGSRDWRESAMLAWARAQDPSKTLYANWPCAVWFHLDRRVRMLPDSTEAANAATMRKFVERMRASDGVLVAWNLQTPETAHTDSLVARGGLVRIAQFEDGAVYMAPPLVDAPAPPVAKPAAPR